MLVTLTNLILTTVHILLLDKLIVHRHKFQQFLFLWLFTVLFHEDYSPLLRIPAVMPEYI